MVKKAIVFDNSGTLIERYKVIKDINTGEVYTDVNSLDLIDSSKDGALLVLQFNTNCLLNLDSNIKIASLIKKHNIKYDVSYSNCCLTNEDIEDILRYDNTTVSDITDGFPVLKEKVPKMELCNGSALILIDYKVKYTITSAGKLFPSVLDTIEELKKRNIEIFIASGDRSAAIKRLANILNISENNAFPTANTEKKAKIVKNLQEKGYKVMMVGDGANDLLAFEQADVSVLTIQQNPKSKLIGKTDYVIKDFSEIKDLDF